MKKIEKFKELNNYFENEDFNIYDYMYYVGVSDTKSDITEEELQEFSQACDRFVGDYTDPIILAHELAQEVYASKNISLQELKEISLDDFYDWYDNGRLAGGSIRYCLEKEEKPIAFYCRVGTEEQLKESERLER